MKPLLISLSVYTLFTGANAFACDIDPQTRARWEHLRGNAGCIVIENGKMLMIEHVEPAKKLGPPGGTPKDQSEPAQCTAAREVEEETSLKVVIGDLVHNFNNNFYVFHCQPKDANITNKDRSLKANDTAEVSKVLWLDPAKTTKDQWRFPAQRGVLVETFVSLKGPKPK